MKFKSTRLWTLSIPERMGFGFIFAIIAPFYLYTICNALQRSAAYDFIYFPFFLAAFFLAYSGGIAASFMCFSKSFPSLLLVFFVWSAGEFIFVCLCQPHSHVISSFNIVSMAVFIFFPLIFAFCGLNAHEKLAKGKLSFSEMLSKGAKKYFLNLLSFAIAFYVAWGLVYVSNRFLCQ